MICTVLHQGLITSARRPIEKTFQGSRHLHSIIVLEAFVQLGEHLVEAGLVVLDLVHHMFNLTPADPRQRGQEINGGFLALLLQLQLLLIQLDALTPLLIVLGLVGEQRDVGITNRVPHAGGSCCRRGRHSARRGCR